MSLYSADLVLWRAEAWADGRRLSKTGYNVYRLIGELVEAGAPLNRIYLYVVRARPPASSGWDYDLWVYKVREFNRDHVLLAGEKLSPDARAPGRGILIHSSTGLWRFTRVPRYRRRRAGRRKVRASG